MWVYRMLRLWSYHRYSRDNRIVIMVEKKYIMLSTNALLIILVKNFCFCRWTKIKAPLFPINEIIYHILCVCVCVCVGGGGGGGGDVNASVLWVMGQINHDKCVSFELLGQVRHFLAATKQLYEWFSLSVRLSVCLSVTPFWLCSYDHRIIMEFSGVITNDHGKGHAKCQDQRSKVKVTEVTTQLNRFRTVTPV